MNEQVFESNPYQDLNLPESEELQKDQTDFAEVAKKAFELVNLPNFQNKKRKTQTWNKRMENVENLWSKERENVFSHVCSSTYLSGLCNKCNENKAVIICTSCPDYQLCYLCDIERHRLATLHNRLYISYGVKYPLAPKECLDVNEKIVETIRYVPLYSKSICKCGSVNFTKKACGETIVVIDITGRFELSLYCLICDDCGEKYNPLTLKNILYSGYWPTSPKTLSCIISIEVFTMWDQFRKHMPGSSETSFLESLNSLTVVHGRVGKIQPVSFSRAFKEWCYCNFQKDKIQQKNWLKCPCCSVIQHSCHVDGNCKLYRYRTSGSRRRESYYKDIFIVNDGEVDSFLKSIYKAETFPKNNNDVTCGGDWSAARNTARKKCSVDYTGLELAACRHQFGLKAVNMKQGELYGLSLFLIKKLLESNRIEFVFADIMCKLWKFLLKTDAGLCLIIRGALSIMHAKGHSLECQVKWDGEWITGTGRSTGEDCEQIFSYLSRCANTTKYQRPENREETLTEHIMFWNRRKTLNLAETLSKKYNKVKTDLKVNETELNAAMKKLNVTLTTKDFDGLIKEVKQSACGDSK